MRRQTITATVTVRWLIGAAACVWLAGCGGGADSTTPPKPPAKKATASEKAPAKEAAAQVDPADAAGMDAPLHDPNYVYRAANRRDPFRSIVVAGQKLNADDAVHPLQQYAVNDLRLMAIVWGGFGSSAMLQTPDGKGYTVRVGMTIGNREGVVKRIQPDHIVIEERFTNLFGEREDKTTKMDLHLPEEGAR